MKNNCHYRSALREFQRAYLRRLMAETNCITEVARISGISTGNVHKLFKLLNLRREFGWKTNRNFPKVRDALGHFSRKPEKLSTEKARNPLTD